MNSNLQVLLANRPTGWVTESDFRLVESPVPRPGPGQILAKVHWLSLDPYMRGRMGTGKSYAKPVEIGDVMTGGTVAEVTESSNSKFKTGDYVVGPLGWQRYAVSDGEGLSKIDPKLVPLSCYLGCVGMPGATACMAMIGPRGERHEKHRCGDESPCDRRLTPTGGLFEWAE